MASKLFSPLKLGGLELANRVVIAPMCQYSAIDGSASNWHTVHFSNMLQSGAGVFIIEATGVEAAGRISHGCLGLYSDANEEALARTLKIVRPYSKMPIGIQLGHAGRKASTQIPWLGGGGLKAGQNPWPTAAPSAVAFDENHAAPSAMGTADMARVKQAFAAAAERALRLGLELIELHGAHGYLLCQFLSPIANKRTDGYGGSAVNRARFPLEVFDAVRAVWPKDKALGLRLNGTDWRDDGITPDEAADFAAELAKRGCDFVHVTSGGNGAADIPLAPGYQVPLAEKVRDRAKIPTIAVGLITDPHHAEAILAEGRADAIGIARGVLNDPRWPWHAAVALGENPPGVAPQYLRGAPRPKA